MGQENIYSRKGCPYENCNQEFKYLGVTQDSDNKQIHWYNCSKCHTTCIGESLRQNELERKIEGMERKKETSKEA